MNSKEENHILIDQYLNNQLNKVEREAFEHRCDVDLEFAKEVKHHTQAEYTIRTESRAQRREQFNQEFDRLSSVSTPFFRKRVFIITSIAAAIALLFLLFWSNIFSTSVSPEALFAQHFDPLEITNDRVIDSSQTTSIEKKWLLATESYIRKDFEQTILLMTEIVNDTSFSNNPKARLYLGLSYMQASQKVEKSSSSDEAYLVKAITQFEQISVESTFIENANWYRALAYLKLGDQKVAENILREIVVYDYHYKSEIAQQILDKL